VMTDRRATGGDFRARADCRGFGLLLIGASIAPWKGIVSRGVV
jgi:hypothetical protein